MRPFLARAVYSSRSGYSLGPLVVGVMSLIWTEIYDPKKHADKMFDASHIPGVPRERYWRDPTLQRYPVYLVRVCGFTFEFHSLEQLQVCLRFFSQKTRPSSRIAFSATDRQIHWLHWVAQRWFERLPMYLLEERRRVRIVPALKQALAQFRRAHSNSATNPQGGASGKQPLRSVRNRVPAGVPSRRSP